MHTPLLRARSAGEILDAAFQFMRAEYAALVLGTAAFVAPPMFLNVIFPDLAVLWNLLSNILYMAASVVPVVLVTEYYVGKPVDVMGALRTIMGRFGAVWAASLISGILMALGLFLLIVPGVIAFARLFAMPSIVLAEGTTGSGSYERSKELTRGYMKHILATLGVAQLIFWSATFGLAIAAGGVGAMMGVPEAGYTFVAEALVMLIYPFVGVVSAMLYIDLRVRKEALDVQLMAVRLGEDPRPVPAV